jgi:competence ComEA-like helix-hairpin-helix protein
MSDEQTRKPDPLSDAMSAYQSLTAHFGDQVRGKAKEMGVELPLSDVLKLIPEKHLEKSHPDVSGKMAFIPIPNLVDQLRRGKVALSMKDLANCVPAAMLKPQAFEDHSMISLSLAAVVNAIDAAFLEHGDSGKEKEYDFRSLPDPFRKAETARPEVEVAVPSEPQAVEHLPPTMPEVPAVQAPEAPPIPPIAVEPPMPEPVKTPEPLMEAHPIPEPVPEAHPIPEPVPEAPPIPEPMPEPPPMPEPEMAVPPAPEPTLPVPVELPPLPITQEVEVAATRMIEFGKKEEVPESKEPLQPAAEPFVAPPEAKPPKAKKPAVEKIEEPEEPEVESSAPPSGVNVNTANIEQLTSIEGLSLVLAKKIIEYRQANGPFKSIFSICRVPGVTKNLFKMFTGMPYSTKALHRSRKLAKILKMHGTKIGHIPSVAQAVARLPGISGCVISDKEGLVIAANEAGPVAEAIGAVAHEITSHMRKNMEMAGAQNIDSVSISIKQQMFTIISSGDTYITVVHDSNRITGAKLAQIQHIASELEWVLSHRLYVGA